MREREDQGGPVVILAGGALLLMVLVLVGAGALFWQRQQLMMRRAVQQEQAARIEAVRARAVAMQQAAASRDRPPVATSDASAAGEAAAVEIAIEAVLATQQSAWNAGDLDAFMQPYWRSEQLTFSSGGKVTRGWQSTLDSYRTRYPTSAEMGELSFTNLEITPLGSQAAMALGNWQLRRDPDPIGGNFTLVFRRFDDQWVIVHDHTSRLDP